MKQSSDRFGGPNALCFRVSGNSMYNPDSKKSYADGNHIVVNPDREAVDGNVIVVRLGDGSTTFRQLLIEPNGEKILHALNPGWPEPTIKLDADATIIGVVTGKWIEEV